MLLPERVRTPVPVLTSETVPSPFWMFPEKVLVWSFAPAVRLAVPDLLLETVPEPERPLTVTSKLLRSSVAVSERLPKPEPEPMAAALPIWSVPEEMIVSPV